MSEEKENKTMDKNNLQESEAKNNAVEEKTNPKGNEKESSKSPYLLIIVLIIIVSAAFSFIYNRLNKIENDIEQSQANNVNVDQDVNNRIENALSSLTSIQIKIEELESKQEVLTHSLSQPVEQQIHINEDYALTEIEHLLIIASYNLQLDHNIATALAAMETAEVRLKGLTDVAALSAREQIIADMNELRSINQADLSGAVFSLSDYIKRVDDLAIKDNVVIEPKEVIEESQEVSSGGFKQFFSLVMEDLKSLIVITRDEDVGKVRLLPDEIYFVRANLKLELANARMAVFNRDTENLSISIELIQDWLNRYFDISDADVRNIYDSLSNMKKMKLELPEMDISSSLESVRALSRTQDSRHQNEDDTESNEELMSE
jgi:uroporphyrin-III C-methyltransferase